MLTMVLRRGYAVPEVVYPFGAPGARYAPGDPIPWALGIAIPRVTDAPDALFEELLHRVEALPTQPLARHYREILEWLTRRLGRSSWIERSGTSIDFLGELDGFFPDARFVHLHRDGREAALSMREYPVLRVAVAVMYGLVGEVEYSHAGLVELERADGAAIDRLLETRPPVELYGRYWSDQIRRGHAAARRLAPGKLLDVRFEDLVADPRAALHRIAGFLEIGGDPEWTLRAAALVTSHPPRRYPGLAADERLRLDAACREAMGLLGRDL